MALVDYSGHTFKDAPHADMLPESSSWDGEESNGCPRYEILADYCHWDDSLSDMPVETGSVVVVTFQGFTVIMFCMAGFVESSKTPKTMALSSVETFQASNQILGRKKVFSFSGKSHCHVLPLREFLTVIGIHIRYLTGCFFVVHIALSKFLCKACALLRQAKLLAV